MARVTQEAASVSSPDSPANKPAPPPGEPPANALRLRGQAVNVPPQIDTSVGTTNGQLVVPSPGLTQSGPGASTPNRKRQWGSRDISEFIKLETIGQGTYGHVYKASDKTSLEIVALKKIKMDNEKEGFPITAIREIKILKSLRHENIVELKEIVTSKGPDQKTLKNVYMVFEYLDHDLAGLLDIPEVKITDSHIKCFMKQLLSGVQYMHRNKILHRDIKGSNLLINHDGYLKIADWGLARSWYEQQGKYTNRVITLWYRPPELLMGCIKYGPAIDMWSVGCIFAELLFKQPILKGTNEVDQLQKIFNLCGDATDENWPKIADECPNWHMFQPKAGEARLSRLRQRFQTFHRNALDLVEKMLTLDPKKRITAKEALDHDYFWEEPLPCDPEQLPKFDIESANEYIARKRREDDKKKKEELAKAPPPAPQPPSRVNMPTRDSGNNLNDGRNMMNERGARRGQQDRHDGNAPVNMNRRGNSFGDSRQYGNSSKNT